MKKIGFALVALTTAGIAQATSQTVLQKTSRDIQGKSFICSISTNAVVIQKNTGMKGGNLSSTETRHLQFGGPIQQLIEAARAGKIQTTTGPNSVSGSYVAYPGTAQEVKLRVVSMQNLENESREAKILINFIDSICGQ